MNRFHRSMSEAFPDERANCGDDKVIRAYFGGHMNRIPTKTRLLARVWRLVRGWFK